MSFEDRMRGQHAKSTAPNMSASALNKVQIARDPMHGCHRGVVPVPERQNAAVPKLNQEPMAGHRRGHPTNTHTHPPATSLAMTRPSATAAKQRTVTISDTGAPNTSLPLPSDSHETGLHLDPTHHMHRAKPVHHRSGLEIPGIHSDPVHGHHVTRVTQRVPPFVHPDDATGLVLPSHDLQNRSKHDTYHMRRSQHAAARGVSIFGENTDNVKGLHVDPLDHAHRKSVAGKSGAVQRVSQHPHMSAVQTQDAGTNVSTSVDLATEGTTQGLHKDVMHNNHRVYKEQNWRSHIKFG